MIKVTAKKDAGCHPVYGEILQGQTYLYDPADPFPDELFEITTPDETNIAPPEQAGKKGR